MLRNLEGHAQLLQSPCKLMYAGNITLDKPALPNGHSISLEQWSKGASHGYQSWTNQSYQMLEPLTDYRHMFASHSELDKLVLIDGPTTFRRIHTTQLYKHKINLSNKMK